MSLGFKQLCNELVFINPIVHKAITPFPGDVGGDYFLTKCNICIYLFDLQYNFICSSSSKIVLWITDVDHWRQVWFSLYRVMENNFLVCLQQSKATVLAVLGEQRELKPIVPVCLPLACVS